uniref:C-type lectin domain-containing protein n=1 Tax=Monopterus albus TaxID=43700 RepID=A0A3Q3JKZ9_MONAL
MKSLSGTGSARTGAPGGLHQLRQRSPWQDAQSFCREYHTDLLTIKSEEENQNLAGTKGWIGLYRQNSAGPWKWSRGDEIATFTSF